MGFGRSVKNMIHSGNQTTNHTTPSKDSNGLFISKDQSGRQEPEGASNFTQYDKKDNSDSVLRFNRSTRYERSDKLESDPVNDMYGETMIPVKKTHDKGFDPDSSELGAFRRCGTIEAGYGNRGSFGTGLAGSIVRTHHQCRACDLGGTGFGGGLGHDLPIDKTVGPCVQYTTKPTENVTNGSRQLDSDPVENANRQETEAGLGELKNGEILHHVVQRDAQFAIDENARDDVHRDMTSTMTSVRETPNDINVEMRDQYHQNNDPREVGERERAVIDKGESINEREIHHVHHIIQPIFNKEIIEQHRIHTTIPIHQVTHEAPIVHKSQTHGPVSMEHFAQRGGRVTGGLTSDQISSTALRSGECSRQVDGEGDNIARELTGSGLLGVGGHFGRHPGEGRPGLDKERIDERDKGVLYSATWAPDSGTNGNINKAASTSMKKRDEGISMYGS